MNCREYRGNGKIAVAETADSIDELARKKLKTDEHFLADLFNSTQSADRDEVDSYLASSDTSDNVLEFWQQKSKVWPRLSACARSVVG